MYTKILIPAVSMNFPVILCDGPSNEVLCQELKSREWVPWHSQDVRAGDYHPGPGRAGVQGGPDWSMKRDMLSPRYSTHPEELLLGWLTEKVKYRTLRFW